MDLGFHRRNRARLRMDAALDYRAIVAELAAAQACGRTAKTADRIARADPVMLSHDRAMAVLMLCESGWVRASSVLGGNFDATLARKFPLSRS
jgi:hypothetical protein